MFKRIRSKLLIPVLAFLTLLGMSACAPEVAGDVVGKDYRPAYTDTVMVPQYMTTCNAQGSCTQTLTYFLPVDQHHPDRWRIRVLDDATQKEHWVTVTHAVYDELHEGSYFSNKTE